MPRIVYLSWAAHEIAGGIKMVFRHVEALCGAGFDACVATPDAKPPTWFDTAVPVLSLDDLTRGTDVLVFPENHNGFLRRFASWPNHKVVFCQNQFMVRRGLGGQRDYADFGVRHVICPTELVAAFCRRRCPQQNILLAPYGIDGQLFYPRRPKGLHIAFAPRKRPAEAAFIRDLFQADNPSWAPIPWVPVDKLSESEVARILGESLLYLSLARFEAFGLLALEALASGCVVAGFTGFGGRDYATSGNGFWAGEDDCLDAVDQLSRATRLAVEGGDRHRYLVDNAQRTAAFYSYDHFVRQLSECWRDILGES